MKFRLEGEEEFFDPNEPKGDESTGDDSKGNESTGNESTDNEADDKEPDGDESNSNESTGDEQTSNEPTKVELDREAVLKYIEENKDLIAELKPETTVPELDEEVKKFIEFKKETGRGYSDFMEYQKEAKDFSEKELVLAHLKSKNPDFSQDELEDELYDVYGYDEDADEDDKDVKRKQREYKKAISEATEHFNAQKEKYKVPLSVNEENVPEEYKTIKANYEKMSADRKAYQEGIDKTAQQFLSETEKFFSTDFKGFEFKVGEDVISHTVQNPKEVMETQSNIINLLAPYMNDDGVISDVAGYHEMLYVARNYKTLFAKIAETSKATAIENEIKASKNIDMSARKTPETINTGFKMKLL